VKSLPDLNPQAISFACLALNLYPDELRCYTRKPYQNKPSLY